jgi:hypothetical protein
MTTKKYSGVNPNNKTSTELNRRKFLANTKGPGVVQRYNWKLEWVATGSDKRIPFIAYLRKKTKAWREEKYLKAQAKLKQKTK